MLASFTMNLFHIIGVLALVQLGASEWVTSHSLGAQLLECFALEQRISILFYHRTGS
jgi:hypothetical protein